MGEERQAAERAPTWPWVLAGALLGSWIGAHAGCDPRENGAAPSAPARVSTGLDSSGERVPSARELRAIEGVGPVRAQRLARAWWEHGPPPSQRALEDLEDIGPATAAKVWQALSSPAFLPRLPAPDRPP